MLKWFWCLNVLCYYVFYQYIDKNVFPRHLRAIRSCLIVLQLFAVIDSVGRSALSYVTRWLTKDTSRTSNWLTLEDARSQAFANYSYRTPYLSKVWIKFSPDKWTTETLRNRLPEQQQWITYKWHHIPPSSHIQCYVKYSSKVATMKGEAGIFELECIWLTFLKF